MGLNRFRSVARPWISSSPSTTAPAQDRPRFRARRGRAKRRPGQRRALPERDHPRLAELGLLASAFRGVRRLRSRRSELRDLRRRDRPRRWLPGADGRIHNGLGTGHILAFGNEEQKRRYLPMAAKGDGSPRGPSPNRAAAATLPDGDDGLVATATTGSSTARRCSSRRGASAASACPRANEPSVSKQKGITAFVVEHGTKGFTASKHLEKLGCRSSDTWSSPSKTCA